MAKSSAAPATPLPFQKPIYVEKFQEDEWDEPTFNLVAKTETAEAEIATVYSSDNADYIVRACNAHQALYEALSALVSAIDRRERQSPEVQQISQQVSNALATADAALALADAAQEGEANGG